MMSNEIYNTLHTPATRIVAARAAIGAAGPRQRGVL
jgi:hypothetical protein